jgi:hypothetical protein
MLLSHLALLWPLDGSQHPALVGDYSCAAPSHQARCTHRHRQQYLQYLALVHPYFFLRSQRPRYQMCGGIITAGCGLTVFSCVPA